MRRATWSFSTSSTAIVLVLAASTARADGTAGACRVEPDDRISCPRALLDRLRLDYLDAMEAAALATAHEADAREDLRAAVALERELADVQARGFEAERRALHTRLAEAPPVRLVFALAAGGVAAAAAGVGCLLVEGCPAPAGWGAVAAGLGGAGVGLGLAW